MANLSTVQADIDVMVTDYNAQNYFDTAAEAATVAKLVLPVESALEDIECDLNTTEVADFLAGFVYGFTGNNWQSYFETCFKDTPAFEADVCTAVNDFATKENQKIIQGLAIIKNDFSELNQFLAACPNAAADIATTENWATYWAS